MPEQKSKIKNPAAASSFAKASKDKKAKAGKQKSKVGSVKVIKVKTLKPKIPAAKAEKSESTNLTISVYGLDGKVAGKITLSSEIFGEKVNKKLLSQAVRVYQANKRQGNASTKTRGEVDGSTRKIYRQKGTGNARHGSVRAPIFVKGGIVHGPKPRDFSLEFPKKMRRKALFSALSAKLLDSEIKVLSGLEKIEPKTKIFASALLKLMPDVKKRRMLLVTPDNFVNVHKATRNIEGIERTSATRLNALEVLRSKHLLFAKEALAELEKVFSNKN